MLDLCTAVESKSAQLSRELIDFVRGLNVNACFVVRLRLPLTISEEEKPCFCCNSYTESRACITDTRPSPSQIGRSSLQSSRLFWRTNIFMIHQLRGKERSGYRVAQHCSGGTADIKYRQCTTTISFAKKVYSQRQMTKQKRRSPTWMMMIFMNMLYSMKGRPGQQNFSSSVLSSPEILIMCAAKIHPGFEICQLDLDPGCPLELWVFNLESLETYQPRDLSETCCHRPSLCIINILVAALRRGIFYIYEC